VTLAIEFSRDDVKIHGDFFRARLTVSSELDALRRANRTMWIYFPVQCSPQYAKEHCTVASFPCLARLSFDKIALNADAYGPMVD
jgi:hypothetical protein